MHAPLIVGPCVLRVTKLRTEINRLVAKSKTCHQAIIKQLSRHRQSFLFFQGFSGGSVVVMQLSVAGVFSYLALTRVRKSWPDRSFTVGPPSYSRMYPKGGPTISLTRPR